MTDIVERLRQWTFRTSQQNDSDAADAAAEIERLRAALLEARLAFLVIGQVEGVTASWYKEQSMRACEAVDRALEVKE